MSRLRSEPIFQIFIGQPEPRPKARRRWERSRVDELWQHDSSIHQWWPAQEKQTLLLTVDDHSRKLLGAIFVPTDTTWNQFEQFRRLFLRHCLPMVVYARAASASSVMAPWPMTVIPALSSNAPSPLWG